MSADFFSIKPYALLLYGVFGLTCLYAAGVPTGVLGRPASGAIQSRSIGTYLVATAAALLLSVYVIVGSAPLLCGSAIAATIFLLRPGSVRSPAGLMAGLSVPVLVLSLVWWRIEPSSFKPLPLFAFGVLAGLFFWALSDPGPARARPIFVPIVLFAVLGVALLVDLGAYRVGQSAIVPLVHHWGAFLGPTLHLRSGLVPFYDVPMQYGLGPTLAIAAACAGNECWSGADVIFAGAYFLQAILFLCMALATGTRRGAIWIWAVVIVVFATSFLWPGFPTVGNVLMAMPSGGGIRFLPTTLIACLWFFGRPKAATVAMVPALLWSPESAAMSMAVFGLCGTAHFGFRRTAVLLVSLLVGSYATLFVIHRSIYGVWIDPLALIEYVLHVPGELPLNPFSDALLLAATLGLGGWLVCRPVADSRGRGRDLAVTALLFAVAVYTLGRSHPNNVCNLAPFLALVALRALDRQGAESGTGVVAGPVAIGLAVSVAALSFSPWSVMPFDPHLVVDVREILPGFPMQEPDVARIRTQIPNNSGLGIADFGPQFARHPTETIVWTPMDPSSLWSYVPSQRRQVYIERSARRLQRSGWAIFIDSQRFLLDDLKVAYNVRQERVVEALPGAQGVRSRQYTVACLDPKPEIAPRIVGPSCPIGKNGVLDAALVP